MGFNQALNQFSILTGIGQGIKFPSVHEARWITEDCKHSPDLWWLEQFEYQLLFCADDTKLNHSRHCLIEDSNFVATAYTVNYFNYWLQEAGDERLPIPVEIPGGKRPPHLIRFFPPPLKVKGELHLVRTPQFKDLDNYKRNTVQFRRKRVNVIVPYKELRYEKNKLADDEPCAFRPLPRCLQGTLHPVFSKAKVHIIRAWMYVAHPTYWEPLLDGGYRGFKIVNYYESRDKPWAKEYYDYPKRAI